jgi:hypothetical protein
MKGRIGDGEEGRLGDGEKESQKFERDSSYPK